MRFIKIFCSLFVVLILCSAFSLKGNKTKAVYIVGVSASFTDSLIYFTDIQLLDSVKLDNNKLLPQRSHYSYQLKNYLEGQEGLVNRTCFVYFDTNKSKLEKPVAKLKAKFQKGQNVSIRPVDPTLFRFTKPEEE